MSWGRLGGDEFAIIQAGEIDQRAAATRLANRIIETMLLPFELDGNEVTVGTSIGIVLAPEHANDPDTLLKMADLALYRVKSAGRNGFCFFEPEMSEAAKERHALETDLRQAFKRGELELYYQPIVDVKTRALCAMEALVRWNHPQKGPILPDKFIPLAEETGLIAQIGEWALLQACIDAAAWPASIKVAVNLSPVQLARRGLVETVANSLAISDLPAARLELEVTETALIDNALHCADILHKCKNIGVSIALDDFGTGYSSLSQLTMFPFDRIKIDRSFTKNMINRSECAAIISATMTLAHSLDIATTAEGVETVEQFKLLRLAGVRSVQGELFGRPRRISDIDLNANYGDQTIDNAA